MSFFIPALVSLASSVIGGLGADKAADQLEAAARAGKAENYRLNQLGLDAVRGATDTSVNALQPYVDAGTGFLKGYADQIRAGAAPAQFDYKKSPGQNWLEEQGKEAVQASVGMRHGITSPATQNALQKNRIGMAAQDYGNQFSRWFAQRQGNMDRQRDMLALGVGSTSDQNALRMGGATTRADIWGNMANAGQNAENQVGNVRAAGTMGVTNSAQAGLSGGLSAWQYGGAGGGTSPRPKPNPFRG